MSVSRVRENRSHGSMRRREATPASRPARAAPEASRRPYVAVVRRGATAPAKDDHRGDRSGGAARLPRSDEAEAEDDPRSRLSPDERARRMATNTKRWISRE